MNTMAEKTPTGAAMEFARKSNCGFCEARRAIANPVEKAFARGIKASTGRSQA
jgi:hypothetical protein